MKLKTTVTSALIALTQSSWIRPGLMMSTILTTVLLVAGCQPHH